MTMTTLSKATPRRLGRAAAVAALVGPGLVLLGTPAMATPPGPNGPIAFVADTSAGAQLFTVRPNGRDLRQLTHLDGGVAGPDWSPDGQSIAFEHDLPDDQGATLDVMDADGSHRRTLASEPGLFIGGPAYAPDGKSVLFVRYDPATNISGIWSLDLRSGRRHEITEGTGTGVAAPQISPNGHTLSFVVSDVTGVGNGLYTSSLRGGRLHELVPSSSGLVDKQDWSPDGRRLATSDQHDHVAPGLSENVFTIRPDGTHLTYLTHFAGGELNAVMGSYSPDGRWIAYRFEDHGRYGLYRMDASGHHRQAMLPLSDLKPRYIDWGSG